jgi:hypothetical protein
MVAGLVVSMSAVAMALLLIAGPLVRDNSVPPWDILGIIALAALIVVGWTHFKRRP